MSVIYTQNPYTPGLPAGSSVFGANEGRKLTLLESLLTHPTHSDGFVDAGDPVAKGGLVGVSMASAEASTEYGAHNIGPAAYNLNVVASNANGTSAVAIGDLLFISSAGIISKDASGTPFGIAMAAASGSASATVIPVLVGVFNEARGAFIKGARTVVSFPTFAAADVAKRFWVAPAAGRIISATEIHSVVAGQAGTLQVEKCNTGEAAASGDVVLASAFDLTSTVNTPVSVDAVTDGKEKFVAGDSLFLKLASGSATSLAGASLSLVIEWV